MPNRTPRNGLETANRKETVQATVDLSSRCFLTRSKIGISRNVKFLSEYFDRNRSNQDPSPVGADHAEALEIGATFPETRGRSG